MPPTIYHQIDGGPENVNAEFHAICSLLVASGLTERVILTRLPPGHTHEDIDAVFALIWKRLRTEFIITPSEFVKLICYALRKKVGVLIKDIFVVPDYCAALRGCVDLNYGRFAKEEWAQLQFAFERVPPSTRHPMGVKTTYRPYVQESFTEIVRDDKNESITGLIPQEVIVRDHPLPNEPPLNILQKLPDTLLCPESFVPGSRRIAKNVADSMIKIYGAKNQTYHEEWTEWRDNILPQSDDVEDYIRDKGLYVPFADIMFSSSGIARGERSTSEPPKNAERRTGMRIVESLSSVVHHGAKKPSDKQSQIPSRRLVQNADGTEGDGRGVSSGVFNPKRRRGSSAPAPAAGNLVPTRRKPRQRLEEVAYDSDDYDDETEDYIFSAPITKPPNRRVASYWQRIGHRLRDVDDGTRFKVIGVCSSDEYDELFYAYYDIDTYGECPPSDMSLWEHTPCSEMIGRGEKSWVEWEDSSFVCVAAGVAAEHDAVTSSSSVDATVEPLKLRRSAAYDYVPKQQWRDTGGIDTSNVIKGKHRRC